MNMNKYKANPGEFWKGFENPSQEEIEAWLYDGDIGIATGKSRMYSAFDGSPKNAWMYSMAPVDLFNIGWIWGHWVIGRNIPPKSFLKFILHRLEHERHCVRSSSLEYFMRDGRMVGRYQELFKNHPWDETPDSELNELKMGAGIRKRWSEVADETEKKHSAIVRRHIEEEEHKKQERHEAAVKRRREDYEAHKVVKQKRDDWFYNKGGKGKLEQMVREGKLKIKAWRNKDQSGE